MFEAIKARGVDQLMALMQQFRADPREQKTDLVVGVYKDDDGAVPIMKSVKAAESRILESETTKNYVGVAGDPELTSKIPALILGMEAPQIANGRVSCVQTPGGTGALRVGCDLIGSIRPGGRIWVSTPTWANHIPIARDAGLTVEQYPYFRPSDRGLDFEGMMAHLKDHAKAGDVILLHACCHNPTGVDLLPEHWEVLGDFVVDRQLLPFVDCAYQGMGSGLEEDVAGLRSIAAKVPEMLIASSFSKNFGIYRERCGGLTAISANADQAKTTMQAMQTVIRSNYSMPPSHGARIVTTVVDDDELKSEWDAELTEMRERIANVRQELRKKLEERQVTQDLSFITNQNGMFSYTGFTPEMVERLREEFGIYTAGDGRINVAGICSDNIDAVAEGFAAVLHQAE